MDLITAMAGTAILLFFILFILVIVFAFQAAAPVEKRHLSREDLKKIRSQIEG